MGYISRLMFIICVLLFAVHQVVERVLHISLPFLDNYLDAFCLMPILLSLWRWERILFMKRTACYRLPVLDVVLPTAFVGFIAEYLFPRWNAAFTADLYDLLAYAAGSVVYYIGQEWNALFSSKHAADDRAFAE